MNLIWTKVFEQTPIQWLNDPVGTFAACVVTNVWLGFPFMMVVALGGLQSIPRELYEAAMIDGASAWQRFKTITLPMLVPVSRQRLCSVLSGLLIKLILSGLFPMAVNLRTRLIFLFHLSIARRSISSLRICRSRLNRYFCIVSNLFDSFHAPRKNENGGSGC